LHLHFLDSCFGNILKYQISWKLFRWEPRCSIGTYMTTLIVAFHNFASSPIKPTGTAMISFHQAINNKISRNVSTHTYTQYQRDTRTKTENWIDVQLWQPWIRTRDPRNISNSVWMRKTMRRTEGKIYRDEVYRTPEIHASASTRQLAVHMPGPRPDRHLITFTWN